MTLIFSNLFRNGQRIAAPETLDATLAQAADDDVLVSLGLDSPRSAELQQVAKHYDLGDHALADASRDHQRAKLERYNKVVFAVLRPATYIDAEERVEFGEIRALVGPNFFIGVTSTRQDDAAKMRASLEEVEKQPGLLTLGPHALLYGLFEMVGESYTPVILGLEEDIDQIEEQLFAGHPGVSRRIYELFNEVIEFQRSARPLLDMLDDLERGDPHNPQNAESVAPELRRRFRDLRERVTRIVERADSFRAQLQNALNVNSTLVAQQQNLVAQQQNEDMKRISGWAAILFAPTLVGAIYGMNFRVMPELNWSFGYPLALGAMALLTVGLYTVFKVKKWF